MSTSEYPLYATSLDSVVEAGTNGRANGNSGDRGERWRRIYVHAASLGPMDLIKYTVITMYYHVSASGRLLEIEDSISYDEILSATVNGSDGMSRDHSQTTYVDQPRCTNVLKDDGDDDENKDDPLFVSSPHANTKYR